MTTVLLLLFLIVVCFWTQCELEFECRGKVYRATFEIVDADAEESEVDNEDQSSV